MITTLPTTVAEAAHIGEDLLKNKGGELLSTLSGACIYNMIILNTAILNFLLSEIHPSDCPSPAIRLPAHPPIQPPSRKLAARSWSTSCSSSPYSSWLPALKWSPIGGKH